MVRFAPIDRQARRCFANQLDTSFQRTTEFAIGIQVFASAASDKRCNFVGKLHNLTSVSPGSWTLIEFYGFAFDPLAQCRMELRTEIHAMTEDFAKLVRKSEIIQSDTSESAGLELRQHIDIASIGFEAVAQCRAEERERTNPSRSKNVRSARDRSRWAGQLFSFEASVAFAQAAANETGEIEERF